LKITPANKGFKALLLINNFLKIKVTLHSQTLPAIAMRQILTTLVLLTGLLSCKDKVGQTDLRQTRIEDQYKDLKKIKEIKFGGGDVWGTTHIFSNADSTTIKVLVEYDAGDYGRGKNEYIIPTINLFIKETP